MSARGWVLFALMSVIWGIPYLLIKVAVEDVSAPVVVFARTAVGAALLLPLALRAARGGGAAVLWRHRRPLLAFAVLEIMGPWWLLSDAERRLPSSTTGLLVAAVPVLGVLIARLAGDRERLGAGRWTGLVLGLAGVAVLAGPELGGGDAWSVTEVLLTALGYAVAPLIAARRLHDVPVLPMTCACLALAALAYAPLAVATRPAALPSAQVLAALAGLGAVCTAAGFVVFFALIREAGPSRAMVFTYVNPAVAVAAGALVLDEPLTATVLAAFALILLGSVLATARGGPDVPAGPDAPVPAGSMGGTADESCGRSRRDPGREPAEERPGSTGQGGG